MATLNGSSLLETFLEQRGITNLSDVIKNVLAARLDQMIAADTFSNLQVALVLGVNPSIRGSVPGGQNVLLELAESVAQAKVVLQEPEDPLTPATDLTSGRDTIGPEFNLVRGLLSAPEEGLVDTSTFTIGDSITGNGLTTLELTVNTSFATFSDGLIDVIDGFDSVDLAELTDIFGGPLVDMTGVNHIAFKSANFAGAAAILDGSTYGDDVSKVSASGTRPGIFAIGNLETSGEFRAQAAPGFEGQLFVGNAQFDNSNFANFAGGLGSSADGIDAQSDVEFIGSDFGVDNGTAGAISTTLYSESGVDANLYIISETGEGASSVNLFEDEIEVNSGPGSASGDDVENLAGAHVFNYVNSTDDRVTASEIAVDLVDINVARGGLGEVVISNFAEISSDIGDAEALGVDVSDVDIDIGNNAVALFEVRNMALNSAEGLSGEDDVASAFAGSVEIDDITVDTGTTSSAAIKIVQIAAVEDDEVAVETTFFAPTLVAGDESAEAGDITIGSVSGTGDRGADFEMEATNRAEIVSGDVAASTGRVDFGASSLSGFEDITIEVNNVVKHDGNESSDSGIDLDSSVGDTTLGSANLQGTGDVGMFVVTGNQTGDTQGSISVGSFDLAGGLEIDAGSDGAFDLQRIARSVDENASIGATNFAGFVDVHGGTAAEINIDISAEAEFGLSSVSDVTVGDLTVSVDESEGFGGEDVAEIDVEVFAGNEDSGAGAAIGDVTLGDLSASLIASGNHDASISIDITAEADSGEVSIGNVTIGAASASAVRSPGPGNGEVDASFDLDIDARNASGDASIGNVTVGDISADGADADVDIFVDGNIDGTSSTSDGVDLSIGDVTVGDIEVRGRTEDASVDIGIDGNIDGNQNAGTNLLSLGEVAIGNIEVFATNASDSAESASVDIQISLDINDGKGDVLLDDVTLGDIAVVADEDGNIEIDLTADAATGDAEISDVVIGNLEITAGDEGNVSISLDATVDNTGDATISEIEVGDVSVVASDDAEISIDISAETLKGEATVSDIDIGDLSATAGNLEDGSADVTVSITANNDGTGDATVERIDIGKLSAFSGNEDADITVSISADANIGDALISDVTIGDIRLEGNTSSTGEISISADARTGDATIDNIDIGDVFIKVHGDNNSGELSISISVDSTVIGNATVSNVTFGDVRIEASDGSATVSLDIDVTANKGDATISDITFGKVELVAQETASISASISASADTGDATVTELVFGDITVDAGVDSADVNISISVDVNVAGNAEASDITIGDIDASSVSDSVSIDIDISAENDGNSGNASVFDIEIGDLSATAIGNQSDDADSVSVEISVSAYAENGVASVADVEIGDISAFTTNQDADVDLEFTAAGNLDDPPFPPSTKLQAADDASISGIKIGNVDIVGGGNNVSEFEMDMLAFADNDATISDVEVGNVTVSVSDDFGDQNQGFDAYGGEISIDITAENVTDDGKGALTGRDTRVSGITFGNLVVIADIEDAVIEDPDAFFTEVTVSIRADSLDDGTQTTGDELYLGDATVSDVEIGDMISTLSGTSDSDLIEGNMDAGLDIEAAGINATITDVTVGNVEATGGGNVDARNDFFAISSDGDAEISDIVGGNVTGVGLSTRVQAGYQFDSNASGFSADAGGSAIITNITVGNVDAAVNEGPSFVLAGLGFLADVLVDELVEDAQVASITDITAGNVSATGGGALALVGVVADVEYLSDDVADIDPRHEAIIDNITIGDLSAVWNGSDEIDPAMGMQWANAPQKFTTDLPNAGVEVFVRASAVPPDNDDLNGDASIGELTVGDISVSALNADDSDGEFSVGVLVRTESGDDGDGDIEDVTFGNIDIAANELATVQFAFVVSANSIETVSDGFSEEFDGDLLALSIGDISLSTGEGGEDRAYVDVLPDTGGEISLGDFGLSGFYIEAAEDIGNIDIGDWSITAGSDSVLDEQDMFINSGRDQFSKGDIEDIDIGNITRGLTGDDGRIRSVIDINADGDIKSVTFGNFDLSATGGGHEVFQAINVGGGFDFRNPAFADSAENVNDVDFGNFTILASDGGDDGEDFVGISIDVVGFDLSDGVGSVGTVDFSDVDIDSIGAGSSAFFDAQVAASDNVGDVTFGNLDLTVDGVDASGTFDLLVVAGSDQGDSLGDVTIGDVTAYVSDSGASGEFDIFTAGGPADDSAIIIGDIDFSLSNSSDADEESYLAFFASNSDTDSGNTAANVSIDSIKLESVVAEDLGSDDNADGGSGRLNSSKVEVLVDVDSAENAYIGNVTVVGGYYADSGVELVDADNFVGDTGGNYSLVSDSPGVDDIDFGDDVELTFVYDQSESEWELDAVDFGPGDFSGFHVEANSDGSFTIFDISADSDGVFDGSSDDLELVTYSFDGTTLTVDWSGSDSGSDSADLESDGFVDGTADLTFTGHHDLLNDSDEVTLSIDDSALPGEPLSNVVYNPADLEVLDNFQVLSDGGDDSWLQVSADSEAYIGDIDYSGYLANPDSDAPFDILETSVLIDIRNFDEWDYAVSDNLDSSGAYEGIQDIKLAQAATEVYDNGSVNRFLGSESGEADTIYISSDNEHDGASGQDSAQLDWVTGFDFASDGDGDRLVLDANVQGQGSIDDGDSNTQATLSNFLTFAAGQTVGTSQQAIYAAKIGSDVYIAYNEDGDQDLNIIRLVGTSLTDIEITAVNGDWVIS